MPWSKVRPGVPSRLVTWDDLNEEQRQTALDTPSSVSDSMTERRRSMYRIDADGNLVGIRSAY